MKNSKPQLLPILLLLLCLFSWIGAYGQITPSGDAFTNSSTATTNYGANGLLNVNGATEVSYIRFDLRSIPSGATISQATLKLYVNSVTNPGTFNVDFVNGSWQEGTITSSVSPVLGSTIEASVPLTAASKNQYVLINITSAVQEWLSGSQANDGIALVANGSFDASFDSKENTNTSHAPELDVVFAGGSGGGTITGVTTAAGSGLTGGGTSGTLNLSLTKSCASAQVLQWSGTAWVCASATGSGTVTSVGLSAPASDFTVGGTPVTTSGTLGLNWNVAPSSANTANAIVKRDSNGSFAAGAISSTLGITSAISSTATTISGVNYGTGSAVYGGSTSGVGVWGQNYGSGAKMDGVHGETSSQSSSGVIGVNSGGGTGVYGSGGTGVTGKGTTGVYGSGTTGVSGTGTSYGFFTDSNVLQARTKGGWAKALVYVNGSGAPYSILRCYNSTLAGSAASTPPCGFNLTEVGPGQFWVDFGFEVDDRFWSVSAEGYYVDGDNGAIIADAYPPEESVLEIDTYTNSGNFQGAQFSVVIF
jgi:hypothetical protein